MLNQYCYKYTHLSHFWKKTNSVSVTTEDGTEIANELSSTADNY